MVETVPVLELPLRLGDFAPGCWREIGPGLWRGEADGAWLLVRRRGRALGQDPDRQLERRLRRRVRSIEVALGKRGHPAILRPLAAGIERSDRRQGWAWLAAERRDEPLLPWQPSYAALDSLAEALAFLHDRQVSHGWVGPASLALGPDGRARLFPWLALNESDAAPPGRVASKILRGLVHEAPEDIAAFGALLPADPGQLEELGLACGRDDSSRPGSGRALLVALRSTRAAADYQARAGVDLWDWHEHLLRVADRWLDAPDLVETAAWRELGSSWLRRARAVRVLGPAGSGKSRLLGEHGEALKESNALVAIGRALAPVGAIQDALGDLFRQGHPVAEMLAQARAAHSPLELLGAALDASLALAVERPVVWIFDDVEQADALNAEAIRALEDRALRETASEDSGLFVITSHGEAQAQGRRPALRPCSDIVSIAITAFDERETRSLVATLMGPGAACDGLAALLHQESAGNAFHTVELLRDLVQDEVLRPRGARWELDLGELGTEVGGAAGPGSPWRDTAFRVPRGLHAMIERRLGRLDLEHRRLLEALAVAEGEVDVDLVAAVLAVEPDAALDCADRLRAQRWLRMGGPAGETLELRDRPARKYLVASLGPEPLRGLHQRWLRACEPRAGRVLPPSLFEPWLQPPPPESQREAEAMELRLALHADAAADGEALGRHGPRAAAAAMRAGSYEEARHWLDRCLGIASRSGTEDRLFRLGRAEVARIQGDAGEAEGALLALVQEAREVADLGVETLALLGLASLAHARGAVAVALAYARRARRLAALLGTGPLAARSAEALSYCYRDIGATRCAMDHAREGLAIDGAISDPEHASRMRRALALMLLDQGEHAEARQVLVEVLATARTGGQRRLEAWVELSLAGIDHETGYYRQSRAHCQRAAELARRVGDENARLWALLNASFAEVALGEDAGAREPLQQAAALARAAPGIAASGTIEWHRAWLEFQSGHVEQAELLLLPFATQGAGRAAPGLAAAATGLRGLIALARGDRERALALLAEAGEQCGRSGRRYSAHFFDCYLALLEATAAGAPAARVEGARARMARAAAFARRARSPELGFLAACAGRALGEADPASVETALCEWSRVAERGADELRSLHHVRCLGALLALLPAAAESPHGEASAATEHVECKQQRDGEHGESPFAAHQSKSRADSKQIL